MSQPLPITVIVPTYRQADCIFEALEGLARQVRPFDELIVSDDASPDDTWAAIEAALARLPDLRDRVTHVVLRRNKDNLGVGRHIHQLVHASRNELVVCNAGDDISLPERLAALWADFQAAGEPRHYLVHSAVYRIGNQPLTVVRPPVIECEMDIERMALDLSLHIGATQGFTRALMRDFSPITRDVYEDLTLGFRAALTGHYRYIDRPLLLYRPGGISEPEKARQWGAERMRSHIREHLLQRASDAMEVGRLDLLARIGQHFQALGLGVPAEPAVGVPESPVPAPTTALSYMAWMLQRGSVLQQRLLSAGGLSPSLDLQVAVAPLGDAADDLAITRESLNQQSFLPAAVAESPWRRALERADAPEWTLLLVAGDALEPVALEMMARALAGATDEGVKLLYCDHDERSPDGSLMHPSFKPDFSPDYLDSLPYMGRALLVRSRWAAQLLSLVAAQSPLVDAYRLMLSAAGGGGSAVRHLPFPLLHLNQSCPATFAADSATWQQLASLLQQHVQERESGTEVLEGPGPGTFHVLPPLHDTPLVSIVIPTRDQLALLGRCIETLLAQTRYPHFELLVVDNDSQTLETREFLAGLAAMGNERIRVISAPGPFNFSRMNNLAVAQARGELVLMLNNDTAVLNPDWLTHMVRHALRPGVGVVGARLLYPEGKVQHAGVVLGLRGPADHPAIGLAENEPGYMFRAQVTQNFSVVTAACLLVPRAVYEAVGGLDEATFGVSYNDVDFCLRVGQTGLRVVWTPLATLLHEGSASQKASIESLSQAQKARRFTAEQMSMFRRWPTLLARDPYYNDHLSLAERGYEVETNSLLWPDPAPRVDRPRVVAFPADAFGCGHYRIIQPMQAMLQASLCDGGISPELFGPHLALRSGADTLVFQRPSGEANLALLESLLALPDVLKVYEVDDNLARVPIKSAHHAHIPKDMRSRMIRCISRCDRLVVSTEPLAHELRGSNADIRVVLNRLPPAMWGERPPVRSHSQPCHWGERKPVVGWAGGVGHGGDLELIVELVRDTHREIDWVFFGMCPPSIQSLVRVVEAGVPTLQYPAKLMRLASQWDLALAPLEVNAFNECKSNLRLLEYGWCGVPVVCSDVTPYQGELPVIRVKNRYKDWRSAVLGQLEALASGETPGQVLQDLVARDWTLTGEHLAHWQAQWTGV